MNGDYYDGYRKIPEQEQKQGIQIRWGGRYRCTKNYTLKRINSRYMLIYIIDGVCDYTTEGGGLKHLEKGDLIFYRPNESQDIQANIENPMTYMGACFCGRMFDDLLENSMLKNTNHTHIGIDNRIIVLFEEYVNRVITNDNYLLLMGLLTNIIGVIEHKLHNQTQKNAYCNQLIALSRAADFIALNYNKNIKVENIAQVTEYSVSRFHYLFKKIYGVSAIDYLINERIQKAKHLLRTTFITISEISYSTGFKDPYYFSKMFKKKTGMSPREYRKS